MNEILWYTSRATGIVSIVLLTYVVVAGVIISGRRRPHGASPTILMALHRWIALGMSVFLLLHITTAIAETYVNINWISFVVPFTSGYAPFQVGLGTLAFDLMIAVLVTSYLRHRIPERRWKGVHWLAYGLWPIAVIHGFTLGTSNEWVLRLITLACGVVGLLAIAWRINARHHDRRRRDVILEQEWS